MSLSDREQQQSVRVSAANGPDYSRIAIELDRQAKPAVSGARVFTRMLDQQVTRGSVHGECRTQRRTPQIPFTVFERRR